MANNQTSDIQYSRASLSGMFRQDYLTGIQNTLRDATGISFFVIDYKGTPVIEHDNTILFCSSKEKQEEYYQSCQMAYAMAAATSAIQSIPYIFNCPSGVLNIAVPIIVKNQYLGALIGGPILCEGSDHEEFETVPGGPTETQTDELNEKAIPRYGKDRLIAIGELVYRLICEVGEKQSCMLDCVNYEHNVKHYEALRQRNSEMEEKINKLTFLNLRMKMPSQLFLNFLTSVSNLAILEKADKTENLISELSGILRQYLQISKDYVTVDQEIKLTEQYLGVLTEQYDHTFDYRINCQPMMEYQQIPSWSMIPYVIYMVDGFLESRNSGGHFFIDVEQNGSMCRISMQMEGAGDTRKGRMGIISDRESVSELMEDTEKRFRYLYKDLYSIDAAADRAVIEIPMGV